MDEAIFTSQNKKIYLIVVLTAAAEWQILIRAVLPSLLSRKAWGESVVFSDWAYASSGRFETKI